MKVAIIGGSGKMGRWFACFLEKEGKEVTLIGRNKAKLVEVSRGLNASTSTDIADARLADAVIISVPIDHFETIVKSLSPHTHSEQTILDITSVKVGPVAAMHRHIKRGITLGTHPVFGPGAESPMGQNFVLTPTSEAETALAEKIKCFLEASGAIVSLMTPEGHDEMMAVILGLAHFIAIVSADTLLSYDRLKESEAVSGVTYRVLLTLVESVLSEDPELYASLQMNLPHLPQTQELFQKTAKSWANLVKNGNRDEFVSRMSALKHKLEQDNPNFGKAYKIMYKIAEGL